MSKQMIKEIVNSYSTYMIEVQYNRNRLELMCKECNIDTSNCKCKQDMARLLKRNLC